MSSATTSLRALMQSHGYQARPIDAPSANYVSVVRTSNYLYFAGSISTDHQGEPAWIGHAGRDFSAEQAREAAQSCAVNLLSHLAHAVDDNADRILRVVRLGVFVASTPDFRGHSAVANGASDVMTTVLGARGKHARTAVGVASLPVGVAVEVDMIVELHP